MNDRAQAIRDALAHLPPARLERRIRATAEARALLGERLGRLDETALRRVLELFNQDVSNGREVQGRFATGLVGRNANLLVGSLDNVNEIVPQLWRADDAWLAANLVALRRGGRLPGGGWLFLSMVLHVRESGRFVPRSTSMAHGLAALEGKPVLALQTGADYLEYCRRVHALLVAHHIDPHGADVLLISGFRLARAAGAAASVDEDELDGPVPTLPAPAAGAPGPADVVPASLNFLPSPSGRAPSSPLRSIIEIAFEREPAAPSPRSVHVAPTSLASTLPSVEVRSQPTPMPVTPASFGWLHLTDLHQGMSGTSWLWPNVKDKMFADLERLAEHTGRWDVVFFTGDLTQRGEPEEFDQLDRTLEQLWRCLDRLGSQPQLVAVPGNHDLTRPPRFDPIVLALEQWHRNHDLRDHVLNNHDNPYLAGLRTAFGAYSAWAARRRWTTATSLSGLLPGDVALSLRVGGVDVGVVGLNSAFLQLAEGDFFERMDVDPRQLHEVCGHDAPAWLRRHDVNFLLTHHPPTWLHPRARQEFSAEIDIPGRFAAHLFGHMHEGTSTAISIGGAPERRALQGASLFGLEQYKDREGRQLKRIHGYSAGRIELLGTNASLRFFPRRMLDNYLGRRINRDQDHYDLDDSGAVTYVVPVTRRTR
ncbi:metallophosphoesterase family protein [Nannocystis pusilla]|uniref:Metallophosphoesterase n=1 Tax=Nannocystis pusilla TaxID=889268 RepID=A0ABS7U2Z6_9BACT|nr:metallophosphoesterase [Nannocystis pusilla]MBZ5714899.1 metallophosphoesterase [Nannocystis pusilla]